MSLFSHLSGLVFLPSWSPLHSWLCLSPRTVIRICAASSPFPPCCDNVGLWQLQCCVWGRLSLTLVVLLTHLTAVLWFTCSAHGCGTHTYLTADRNGWSCFHPNCDFSVPEMEHVGFRIGGLCWHVGWWQILNSQLHTCKVGAFPLQLPLWGPHSCLFFWKTCPNF